MSTPAEERRRDRDAVRRLLEQFPIEKAREEGIRSGTISIPPPPPPQLSREEIIEQQRKAMAGPEFRMLAAQRAAEKEGYGPDTRTTYVEPSPSVPLTPAEVVAGPSANFAGRFGSYPVNKKPLRRGGLRRSHAKANGHRKSRRHTRRRAARRTRKH